MVPGGWQKTVTYNSYNAIVIIQAGACEELQEGKTALKSYLTSSNLPLQDPVSSRGPEQADFFSHPLLSFNWHSTILNILSFLEHI